MNKRDLLTHIQVVDWKKQETRVKTSFWASDCLRPSCDIYWKWINEPETNPIEPEKLLLMKVGKLYEQELVRNLIDMGEIKDLGDGQMRVEMEREFIPITGYMDAVHKEGYPIEIKTHYAQSVDSMLESGKPPSEHYCHQLAVYMDFMGVDKGLLISANRANGNIWFSEMIHHGDLVFECKGYVFDLEQEYKRFRGIMEKNIHPRKEPDLDYFYRPDVTKSLLDQYKEDKIKKAIKGERILSDHNWRYQYSSFKDRVIEKESVMKGVSVDELCRYTDEEIQFMMDYLGVEWKQTKRGMQLYKKKPQKKK